MTTPSHQQWLASARIALDQKTKPPGSLGLLEIVCAQLCAIQKTHKPVANSAQMTIFAADHGVVEEGVSAYPQAVTGQMLLNFAAGGAAINVLCRCNSIELELLDCGINGEPVPGVRDCRIAAGTANMAVRPAMSEQQLTSAMAIGEQAAARALEKHTTIFAIGEMGIGNTTAAAAITSAICELSASFTTGRGTGLDDKALNHKAQVIEKALSLHRSREPAEILRCLGGFEIAAMAGAILKATHSPMAILVDGYIATAAALCAVALEPACRENLIFAHESAEPGHQLALAHLDATALLKMDLRLGEGSGAALAIPLLRSAAAIMSEMATFDDAGVARAKQ